MLSKLTIFITICICCFFLLSAQVQEKSQTEKWQSLVQSVQDVLAGKSIGSKNIIISPSAYLAFGKTYENLRSVVTGDSKTCSLKEDSTRGGVRVVVKVNDSENAAFVTLKTQTGKKSNERIHTVVFMKDSTGIWNIEAWCVSN
jgi:hypothetical protein